ncbi:MAG TPA: GNAT family N-acetyltransferase [Acidimicrobiia bacterium]|nr:GNAT family N-acetyltransferase [Acidimicrobiia bacterium]
MTVWNQPGFDLAPVAQAVGPFDQRGFFEAVSPLDEGEPFAAEGADSFIPLRRVGEEILFAGDADLTDYHTPFGGDCETLIARVADEQAPGRFTLDSLPEEAAKPLAAGLAGAGWNVEVTVHEVAAVLDLPGTYEEYLAEIGKKERHEVRRKRRRYERMVGEVRHETHRGIGWGLDEFIRLHRMSAGGKGEFMTEERQDLFTSLALLEGWRVDLLRAPDDSAAAAVFGYTDDTGYYLYNSAYDSALSDASPGVVLLGTMIERAIAEGFDRFDFLKGDEGYKFRLGARRRPLNEIVAVPGGGR